MPNFIMKCLTVLYLHYNEAMQNLCFFIVSTVIPLEQERVAVQMHSLWLNFLLFQQHLFDLTGFYLLNAA